MKHWWKILGVMLLLYTLTIGMLAPLSPGITLVTPNNASTGDTITLTVTGYNSNFTAAKEIIRVWLKIDDENAICAESIQIIDDRQLGVTFIIPNSLPTDKTIEPTTLLINNDKDGSSIFPDAVFIKKSDIPLTENDINWTNCLVDYDNLFVAEAYNFPFRNILVESIRNLYFHVPMWFAMIFIFLASMIFSIKYLMSTNPIHDARAMTFASVGVLYGLMGLLTGGIWAQYTWGAFWSFDVKQNMSAIAMLIYMAYFVLRGSMDDYDKRARIGAVYNIFAFATLIPLLFIIPRMTESLHPGNGGNPGFGGEDLDNTMRTIFYPAIIGWTLLAFWISQVAYRFEKVKAKVMDEL